MIRALGAEPPVYAHVPTVLGEDGQKLSKRHGAVSVMQYEEMGYLPEAMINFLARLGWSHGDDEIFSREELVAWFDLDNISASPSRFDTAKLAWVDQEHMKRLPADELGRRLAPYLARKGLRSEAGPDAAAVALLLRERVATLVEMADAARYFYAAPSVDAAAIAAQVNAGNRAALAELAGEFATVEWTRDALGAALKAAAARHGLKPGQVMMPLRVAVCGTTQTPAIDAVLALIGRDATRARLEAALA
jgi:glutamyl-tRNA synthetase